MQMMQINHGRPAKYQKTPLYCVVHRILPGNMQKATAKQILPMISKAEKIIHGMWSLGSWNTEDEDLMKF
jgi:hypothetical protein